MTQMYVPPGHIKVTMLNIGQGDALLIQIGKTQFTTTDVLIDAGPNHSVVYELGDTLPPWNRDIEYAMATHEDADHIGGFAELTGQYLVEQWIISGREKDTSVSHRFHAALEGSHGGQRIVQRGDSLEFESGVYFTILNPTTVHHEDINDDSIMGILSFGDFSVMLTGDGSILNEDDIIQTAEDQGISLDVDILKAGHHGSKTSTSPQWLAATKPEIVLISAGVDNSFGHPHYRVITDIEGVGAMRFQSNIDGRTACMSDGQTYHCAPTYSPAARLLTKLGFSPI